MFKSKFSKLFVILALALVLCTAFVMNTPNASAHSTVTTQATTPASCVYDIVYQSSGSMLVRLDECQTQQLIQRYNGGTIPTGLIALWKRVFGVSTIILQGYAQYAQWLDTRCSNRGIYLWVVKIGNWNLFVWPIAIC